MEILLASLQDPETQGGVIFDDYLHSELLEIIHILHTNASGTLAKIVFTGVCLFTRIIVSCCVTDDLVSNPPRN